MPNRFINHATDTEDGQYYGQSFSERSPGGREYHSYRPYSAETLYKNAGLSTTHSAYAAALATEPEMTAALDKLALAQPLVKAVYDFLKKEAVSDYITKLYICFHLGHTLATEDIYPSWVDTIFWNKRPDLKNKKIDDLEIKKTEKDKLKKEWDTIWNNLKSGLAKAKDNLVMSGVLKLNDTSIPIRKGAVPVGCLLHGNKKGVKRNSFIRLDQKLAGLKAAGKISLTDDELDLFQRISQVETSGNIQALNTWDSGVMSIGFMQVTYHTGKLQWLIKKTPEVFKKYGIELDEPNAVKEYNRYTGYNPPLKNITNNDDLRWGIWAERFYYAGLDEAVIIAEVELVKELLKGQYEGFGSIEWYFGSWKSKLDKEEYKYFKNYYDNGNNYLKALLQETFNNKPERAAEVFNAVFAQLTEAEKQDWKIFLEKFEAALKARTDFWKDYPEDLAKGVQLSTTKTWAIGQSDPAPAVGEYFYIDQLGVGLVAADACCKWDSNTNKCAEYKPFKIPATTGFYIPQHFDTSLPVFILLYLHGHRGCGNGTIRKYFTESYFKPFGGSIEASGKNIILVAPTIGPLSQGGNLNNKGGMDEYLTRAIDSLNKTNLFKNIIQKDKVNIILAAHSGGGKVMLNIMQKNNVDMVVEVWGFDCLYQSPDSWNSVALNFKGLNEGKETLFFYNRKGTRTAKFPEGSVSKNWLLDNSTHVEHNEIPAHYLPDLLKHL